MKVQEIETARAKGHRVPASAQTCMRLVYHDCLDTSNDRGVASVRNIQRQRVEMFNDQEQ